MHMVDISFLIYVLVALIVGVCWAIFRERPNGHYSTPEEGVFMSAALIGALNVASGLTADGRWPANIIANEEGDVPREMSRLVYCARASKAERAGADHPTVKPVALMQYLARLIIPQGGTLLDPFAGTGTAGIAATREGMSAVLIEIDHTYATLAQRRITADAPLLAAS